MSILFIKIFKILFFKNLLQLTEDSDIIISARVHQSPKPDWFRAFNNKKARRLT